LHENNLPFVNGGEPFNVVEISTPVSLSVIVGVLIVSVVASLVSVKVLAVRTERHISGSRDKGPQTDPVSRD
jgi:tellurite resistance protein TerC